MDWTRGSLIGRGATASVSLAFSGGNQFAVKSTELSQSISLQKEMQILSQLCPHPHIVRYFGYDITTEANGSDFYNLFMEYVPHGTLSDAIKKQGGGLSEDMIQLYAHQILQGLDHLQMNGIVHCDIKSDNILVASDGSIKIADMGCARFVENGSPPTTSFSGTPVFMSPEVARGEQQGFPADIWALGCTIIQMATGSNPWPEVKNPISVLHKIGYSTELPEFPRQLTEEAMDFLKKCLARDPKERWTAKQLLAHPFLANVEANFEQMKECNTKDSPTCVLDQDFWDSLEEGRTRENSIFEFDSIASFPAERILRLKEDASNVATWTWDESWITVRSHEIIDATIVAEEPPAEPAFDRNLVSLGEDIECSITQELSLESASSSNSFSTETEMVMDCVSVENPSVLLTNYDYETANENHMFLNINLLSSNSKSLWIVSGAPHLKSIRDEIHFEVRQDGFDSKINILLLRHSILIGMDYTMSKCGESPFNVNINTSNDGELTRRVNVGLHLCSPLIPYSW